METGSDKEEYQRTTIFVNGKSIDKEDFDTVVEIFLALDAEVTTSKAQSMAMDEACTTYKEGRISTLCIDIYPPTDRFSAAIGRLQKLKYLHIGNSNAKELPEEIGNLTNLEQLVLECPSIESFPTTMGRLQNLKTLRISDCNIRELPEEIGNLTGLEWLDLFDSSIESLPSNICNLINLKVLAVYATEIKSLPCSVNRLTNLTYLHLYGTSIFSGQTIDYVTEYLLMLTNKCRSLGTLGVSEDYNYRKVGYQLARNRARYRTKSGTVNGSILHSMPHLWPVVISCVTKLFANYPQLYDISTHPEYPNKIVDMIYQLLIDEREPFIAILLARRNVQRGTKRSFQNESP